MRWRTIFFLGGNFPGRCRLGMNKSQVPQDSELFFFFFCEVSSKMAMNFLCLKEPCWVLTNPMINRGEGWRDFTEIW